jgi:anthranilate synthase component 2
MVLLLDNYDSFTFNLAQYLGELGADPLVRRNDAMTVEDILELRPDRIVISPGPGHPRLAGVSVETIRRAGAGIPILGVCLGHQAIGFAFGAVVDRASTLMHGKTSLVKHDGAGVFAGVASPLRAGRYHSLSVHEDTWPRELEVTARAEDGTVMGIRHRAWPVHGVQFHPESVLTNEGRRILRNFLEM